MSKTGSLTGAPTAFRADFAAQPAHASRIVRRGSPRAQPCKSRRASDGGRTMDVRKPLIKRDRGARSAYTRAGGRLARRACTESVPRDMLRRVNFRQYRASSGISSGSHREKP